MKIWFVLLFVAGITPGGSGVGAFPTLQQALENSFPGARIGVEDVLLTEAEQQRISELSGLVASNSYRLLRAADGEGILLGMATVSVHRIKTKRQSLLISWDEDGRLLRPQLLGFAEPRQYLPRANWFKQFDGLVLSSDLRLRSGIDGVSGATLSSRVAVSSAREALALDLLLATRDLPQLDLKKLK